MKQSDEYRCDDPDKIPVRDDVSSNANGKKYENASEGGLKSKRKQLLSTEKERGNKKKMQRKEKQSVRTNDRVKVENEERKDTSNVQNAIGEVRII